MNINSVWHQKHPIPEFASFQQRVAWKEEHAIVCECDQNTEDNPQKKHPQKKSLDFKQNVYAILRTVPKGKVVTYGQLARLAGSPKAARAVGMCMQQNTDVPATPCHRVVASNGALHGYSAGEGVPTKKKMLLDEGVVFRGEKVDLEQSLWKI